jgi:CHAT domain-containing protein
VALLITNAGAVARSAALPGATEIESFAAAVRRGEAFDGEALSAALFGPFEDELQAIDRLWLVVDGALAAMPFGALPWRGEHFGTRFAYAVLPTPGVPRRDAVGSVRGEVLLAGAPLFDNATDTRWAPLPFAARELARLEGMWQERATLLVGDALRAAALETIDWRRFGLIHFATHAEASSVDPRANGLVLADAERFGLDQVLARSFDDATVVLSACSTAEGERVPGQGRLGLVWAFHLAGAAEVVASQWAVDDRSTAETMASLHAALRSGLDAAQAMRRVRRECVAASCPTARWAVFEVYRRP